MNNWYKVDFNDVFFNGLTTAEVGCVVKYKCMCQQLGVKELDEKRIKSLFTLREQKFVQNYFKVCSKNAEVCSENEKVCQKNAEVCRENEEVCQENAKVCSKNDNKNKGLAPIYNIYNNINNTSKREEKEERDKRDKRDKIDKIDSDKSPYVFSGSVIRLNKKDFDEWSNTFPELNLRAELLVRDNYLANQPEPERKKWFMSTFQYFIKQNEKRKAQNKMFDNDDEQEDMEDWLRRSVR